MGVKVIVQSTMLLNVNAKVLVPLDRLGQVCLHAERRLRQLLLWLARTDRLRADRTSIRVVSVMLPVEGIRLDHVRVRLVDARALA